MLPVAARHVPGSVEIHAVVPRYDAVSRGQKVPYASVDIGDAGSKGFPLVCRWKEL